MSVTPDKSKIVLAPNGKDGVLYVDVTYTGGMTYEDPVITYTSGQSGWLDCVESELIRSDDVDVVRYKFEGNSFSGSVADRRAVITFEDSTGTADIDAVQLSFFYSIWYDNNNRYDTYKDGNNNITIPAGTPIIIKRISSSGSGEDLIFKGVKVGIITIKDIVKDYINIDSYEYVLSNTFHKIQEQYFFEVDAVIDGVEYEVAIVGFFCDWSQYRSGYESDMVLSDPINHKGCPGMWTPFSFYNHSGNYTQWKIEKVNTSNQVTTYTNNLMYSFVEGSAQGDVDTKTIRFKKGNDVVMEYDMTHCGTGVLYYLNRFGGYDSFLVEGNISKSEEYVKNKYRLNKGFSNTANTGEGIVGVNIRTRYQFNTGWLTDDEAERLVYHMLSSPQVGFVPFETVNYVHFGGFGAKGISVNIVDSTAEYKKFKNGRRMVQYTITLEESQIKSRES